MLSAATIWAIVLRHLYLWKRDINLLLAVLYWPLLDILIWGFLGSWIQQAQPAQNYGTAALLGVLLWQLVGRGANAILFCFNEELWANNIINLFGLPLRITEWICSAIIVYIVTLSMSFLFSILFVYLLYDVSLCQLLSAYVLFFLPTFFCGIWLGFMSLLAVIKFGKRGIELAFVISWFLMPFSGVFYPLEVLPHWAQTISQFLPMSYLFEGMRAYVMHQQNPLPYLVKGFLMAVAYAAAAIVIFIYLFNRSKNQGLARLMD